MACWRQTGRQAEVCEEGGLDWLRDRFTLIVVFYLFMPFASVSLLWCNRFIFFGVECGGVKNRTHALLTPLKQVH